MSILIKIDPKIAQAIFREKKRQKNNLNLIPSENFVSKAVLEAQGSIMTNKYAEGYSHNRYYYGCEYVDVVEDLAIERAKKIFNTEHVNVQPHSGTQANMAVYFTILKPGDTVLSMNLTHGGHLSHGSSVNFSGKLYNFVFYGVDKKKERIDFNQVEDQIKKYKPKLIIVGASSYPRIINFKIFHEIATKANILLMADIAHIAGLVAVGLHNSPVPYCDFVTTTTHKTLRGPRGGIIMCQKKYAKMIDKGIFPGIQGGPLMHIIAAKAVAFQEVLSNKFYQYQKQVLKNAKILAKELISLGYRLVSGGTENHLILIDLRDKGITGKTAGDVLNMANIIVNKNVIPFDKESPVITSGIRIGTPGITSRGMKENEMIQIAHLIHFVIMNINNKKKIFEIREQIQKICSKFPLCYL